MESGGGGVNISTVYQPFDCNSLPTAIGATTTTSVAKPFFCLLLMTYATDNKQQNGTGTQQQEYSNKEMPLNQTFSVFVNYTVSLPPEPASHQLQPTPAETTEIPFGCGQFAGDNNKKSGVYFIRLPTYGNFYAYCEMGAAAADVCEGEGGGGDSSWMVLQRRTSPLLRFWDEPFDAYANGFGNPSGDHWLGLDRVYALGHVTNRSLQLRIEIFGDQCGVKRFCSSRENGYWWGIWNFTIANRLDAYRIDGLAVVAGNLSDPEQPKNDVFAVMSNGQRFTAVDADNDLNPYANCAKYKNQGGWWMKDCTFVALNGEYTEAGAENPKGRGQFWHYSPSTKDSHYSFNIKPRKSKISFRVV